MLSGSIRAASITDDQSLLRDLDIVHSFELGG